MNDLKNIGARIKQLRLELGMSQDELAQKTGYSDRSSIAKIENGEVNLNQKKTQMFADALGVSPGFIMGWSKDRKLRADETKLLKNYNLLNQDGKQRAQSTIEDLIEIPRYTHSALDTIQVAAAHNDSEDFTEDEWEAVTKFAAFVKEQNKAERN